MILVNELKGKMVAKGLTQTEVANMLGITQKTLSSKLQKGVFDSDEIYSLIDILDIEDPVSIFLLKMLRNK